MMAEGKGPNKCGCKPVSCQGDEELCTGSTCKICKANCLAGCESCDKICEAGRPCKCCTPICGCKNDCYAKDGKGNCQGLNSGCKRCTERKCISGEPCICYRCSCGTQCNGLLCACCYFCNPGKCQSKDTCDGFVLGKCFSNDGKCKGHWTYNDSGRPVYVENCTCEDGRTNPGCKCYKSEYDSKCRCIRGVSDGKGNCLIKCDLCGKLCSQDSYIHQGTLVVVPLAIAMVIIIVWCKYRDKFRRVFYELSGSFSGAPKHSSAYTNNLVGDKIPEEMNTDRYPAFRPMPYAGLA